MCERDECRLLPPPALLEPQQHHVQSAVCRTRALYRQGRRFTAVKVYSVCSESAHVLLGEVPALSLRRELAELLARHGRVTCVALCGARADTFTETYRVHYADQRSARAAKRRLDTLNWYGGSLHVCYAPELESVEETRHKLTARRREVAARLRLIQQQHDMVQQRRHTSEAHTAPADAVAVIEDARKKTMRKRTRPITNTVLLPAPAPPPCFLPLESEHSPSHLTPTTNTINTTTTATTIIATSTNITTTTTVDLIDVQAQRSDGGERTGRVTLNYDRFGEEEVRTVHLPPPNKIRFNIVRRS